MRPQSSPPDRTPAGSRAPQRRDPPATPSQREGREARSEAAEITALKLRIEELEADIVTLQGYHSSDTTVIKNLRKQLAEYEPVLEGKHTDELPERVRQLRTKQLQL